MTKRALTKRNRRSLRSKTLRSQKGGGLFDGFKSSLSELLNKLQFTGKKAVDNVKEQQQKIGEDICSSFVKEIKTLKEELKNCKNNNNSRQDGQQIESGQQDESGKQVESGQQDEQDEQNEASVMIGGKKRKRRGKKSKKRHRKNKKKTRRRRRR